MSREPLERACRWSYAGGTCIRPPESRGVRTHICVSVCGFLFAMSCSSKAKAAGPFQLASKRFNIFNRQKNDRNRPGAKPRICTRSVCVGGPGQVGFRMLWAINSIAFDSQANLPGKGGFSLAGGNINKRPSLEPRAFKKAPGKMRPSFCVTERQMCRSFALLLPLLLGGRMHVPPAYDHLKAL